MRVEDWSITYFSVTDEQAWYVKAGAYGTKEDDSLFEETGVDVVAPFAPGLRVCVSQMVWIRCQAVTVDGGSSLSAR